MKEIPRVDESDLPTLFYSEADIDGMYQEAEGEWRCGEVVVVVVVVGCCWWGCFVFVKFALFCLLFFLIDIFYCSVIVFFSDQVLSATLPLTTASRTGTATQSDFNSTI